MSLKSLETSFIYSHLNKSGELTKAISALISDGIILTKDDILVQYSIIQRKSVYPLRARVLNEFDKGNIQLRLLPEKYRIPTSLPFVLMRGPKGNIVSVIPVNMFGAVTKDNNGVTNISVDPVKLYTLMESAYFAREMWENQHKVSSSTYLIKNGSEMFSGMFTRVLNKTHALNAHREIQSVVLFLSGMFYLVNILGLKISETSINYALGNLNQDANPLYMEDLMKRFPESAFDNISTFITELAKPDYGLNIKDLTVRGYLEKFIGMYDSNALLSLESLPYFTFNILSVMYGAYLNNQYVLEDIMNKNVSSKYYTGLMALDGGRSI